MSEIWLRIQAFVDILSTRNVLIEVGVLGVCLLIGGLAGLELNRRNQRRPNKPPMALSWRYFGIQGNVVVTPIIVVLVLVLIANSSLQAAHIDVTLLGAASRLILAYIVVRSAVLVFAASLGNKSWIQNWETRVALLIWLAIAAEYLGWLDPIIATLDSLGVAAGKSRITVWSVLKLLFTLTLFVLVAAWISRWVERRVKRLTSVAMSTRIGIAKFANAFLIGLSVLIGLNAAGVDLTALTVLTGAVGLGLGFGLQSIAANFVSGFVLLMDRSIKPGDVISLSGQSGTSTENFGWVQELRGRYVVVRDRDGVEMLVPNQQLISNAVINWSYTDPRIRLKLPIRISYRDDPELALKILMDACEGQARVLRDPAPVSRLMHFSDSGIELELRFWISDPQEGVNNVRSEVNRAIWRLFKEHQITIPTAQREIIVRNAASELD
ncbi:MAG TPA: mechanosensitive ion channel domain-containing protein [Steroidobacteraceae bacterium]|jgi:small-conductance mechanosensitive channel|nr:mechanosensitive ion channel domain-containing protein [Steroidobacteraceae bacterium]